MAKQLGSRDAALGSANLFGDDSEDDFWLNDVFEGENDPEVLEQVTSALSQTEEHNLVRAEKPKEDNRSDTECEQSKHPLTSSPEFDSDEDTFQAGQGGYILTSSDWNAHGTPVTAWDLSQRDLNHKLEMDEPSEPENNNLLPEGKDKPLKPSRGKKRKGEALSENEGGASALPLPPSVAASLSWAELVRQHESLLASKGKVTGRKFNKTALDLLNWCASKIKQNPCLLQDSGHLPDRSSEWQPGPFPSTSSAPDAGGAGKTLHWEGEKEALSEFRALLLNAKEIQSEEMVARVVAYVEKGLPPLLTADEKRDMLMKRSLAFVQELSPQLSLKTGPVIRSYVNQIFDAQLDRLFAEIVMPEKPAREKAIQYRRMFCRFIDDRSCVTFACTSKSLLGRLPPRDVWFLTFFAFVTSRRVRGDNLLQLGCSGLSCILSLLLKLPNPT